MTTYLNEGLIFKLMLIFVLIISNQYNNKCLETVKVRPVGVAFHRSEIAENFYLFIPVLGGLGWISTGASF